MRLLALLAGSLVLIVPPIVMADHSRHDMPGWMATGGPAILALAALSFLYIAAFGSRMRRSPDARMLGGLLLAIPAMTGIAALASCTDPALLWCSGVLVSFAVLLFLSFVFPAAADRRQRPLRERERTEPVLLIVQRHPSTERRASRF